MNAASQERTVFIYLLASFFSPRNYKVLYLVNLKNRKMDYKMSHAYLTSEIGLSEKKWKFLIQQYNFKGKQLAVNHIT